MIKNNNGASLRSCFIFRFFLVFKCALIRYVKRYFCSSKKKNPNKHTKKKKKPFSWLGKMLSSFRCEPCVALGVDSLMAFQRGDCDEQWLCVFQEKIASCLSYLLWVFVVQMLDTTKSNKPESLTPQSFSEERKWSEPSESEVSCISPSPRRQRFQKPSAVSITNIPPSFVRSRVVVYLTVTDRLR